MTQEEIEALPPEQRKLMEQVAKRREEVGEKSGLMWSLVQLAESMGEFINDVKEDDTQQTTSNYIEFIMGTLISLERKGLIKIK
jgi:hypothetical protein